MTIDKLFDIHNRRLLEVQDHAKAGLFLEAVRDWPNPVNTVEGFLAEIKTFLETDEITSISISNGMKNLDPGRHLWELEALSALLELTQLQSISEFNNLLLKYIVDEIE